MEKAKKIPYYGSLALLAYMPFHIFLSQWLSTFTGGLDAWKVGKDVFTMVLVWVSFGLVLWTKAYKKTPYLLFVGLAFLYLGLHILLYFVNKETALGVAALATVYNSRLLWFLIIGMSVALLTPREINWTKLSKFMLTISTITVVIGLAQYVLPKDIMEHFGYSIARGVKPAFFIDDKTDLPRIFSTLRDPNSYGAFLIIPMTLLWTNLLDKKQAAKRVLLSGLFGLHGLALFLTFSRGAWAGAAISLLLITLLTQRQLLRKWFAHLWPVIAVSILVLIGGIYMLRDQYALQNIIFHSDETTLAELDSNDLHVQTARAGLGRVVDQPVGYGPGTAGIVSIQNPAGTLLTENYYVQILHEVGVLGFIVFAMVLFFVVTNLLKAGTTGKILLATGVAYTLLSLIMHLWTNEVLAAYWWTLAGVSIVSAFRNSHNKQN